jgi:hypothetical protein
LTRDKLNLIFHKSINEANRIERCITYLTKVAKIKIQSEYLWHTISLYNILRNKIVYAEGCIDATEKEWKTFRDYTESNPLLTFEDCKDDSGAIALERGFCKEALDNFEMFINELEKQLIG